MCIQDEKFGKYLNVGSLDNIYTEYFSSDKNLNSVVGFEKIMLNKNRCFKDLYNILEESMIKFFEIFN